MTALDVEVALLEAHEAGVLERDRVHRQLVPEDRGVLERPDALGRDHAVVLVDVRRRRQQDEIGLDPAPERHEVLEDRLPVAGKWRTRKS